jgi:hypothetical protein
MSINPHPNHPRTLYTFCRQCECRLHLPEEWRSGYCTFHASPIGARQGTPPPLPDDAPEWQDLLRQIDALLDEAPTGVIPRPNRDS